MKSLFFLFALVFHLTVSAQVTQMASYDFSMNEGIGKRRFFEVFPLRETGDALFISAEVMQNLLKVEIRLMDSTLKVRKETSLMFEKDCGILKAEVQNNICHILLYNAETDKGETYQLSVKDFSNKRYPFSFTVKKLVLMDVVLFNNIWYLCGTNSVERKIFTIDKGRIFDYEFDDIWDGDRHLYGTQIIEHETEPELAFVFFKDMEGVYAGANKQHGMSYRQKNGFNIVLFTKRGSPKPIILGIPFFENSPVKDITLAKMEGAQYFVVGTYTEASNKLRSGFFSGKITDTTFSFIKKYRYNEIENYLTLAHRNPEKIQKKIVEENFIVEADLLIRPLRKTGLTYTSVMEFYIPSTVSAPKPMPNTTNNSPSSNRNKNNSTVITFGPSNTLWYKPSLYPKTFTTAAVIEFDSAGNMIFGTAYPMKSDLEFTQNNTLAGRADYHTTSYVEDNKYILEYNIESMYYIKVFSKGKIYTEKEYELKPLISSGNKYNAVIMKWWYKNNILAYDNATSGFIAPVSSKKYSVRRISWK